MLSTRMRSPEHMQMKGMMDGLGVCHRQGHEASQDQTENTIAAEMHDPECDHGHGWPDRAPLADVIMSDHVAVSICIE